ncbi:MAG TPA: hypothetical protein VFT57_03975 [Gemmatimonadaceae bacterium]|nr:hypothetical protein [Gemmatimonadaceae bacterium]
MHREQYFARTSVDEYREVEGSTLHLAMPSSANVTRQLNVAAPGALCTWYTSNSAPTKRGAFMVYVPGAAGYWTWYVALAAGQPWHITRTKGITQAELQRLERLGTGAATA